MAPDARASAWSLIDQLEFYGSYHSHPGNVIVHLVFVPLIFATTAVWLCYTGALVGPSASNGGISFGGALPPCCAGLLEVNLAAVVLGLYVMYYLALEPFAGLTWTLFQGLPSYLIGMWALQNVPTAWAYSLGLHVLSWFMQVYIGHVVLEKRKPALLDSLFQSFALAPLFVWLEVLFFLGYRKTLYSELQSRVQRNIAVFRSAQGTTRPLIGKEDSDDVHEEDEGEGEARRPKTRSMTRGK